MQTKTPEDPYAPYTPTNMEWYWADRRSKSAMESTHQNYFAIKRLNRICSLLTICLGLATGCIGMLFYLYFKQPAPVVLRLEKASPTTAPLLPKSN